MQAMTRLLGCQNATSGLPLRREESRPAAAFPPPSADSVFASCCCQSKPKPESVAGFSKSFRAAQTLPAVGPLLDRPRNRVGDVRSVLVVQGAATVNARCREAASGVHLVSHQ